MSARIPKPGALLNSDDYSIVVVSPGTTPLDGLLTLIEETTGDLVAADHPAIVEAAQRVRVETWWSCSTRWKEANGGGWDYQDYWSRDGDGKRKITVAMYEGSPYDLANEAAFDTGSVSS